MAIRKILTEGDPALTKVCHSVTKFDQKLWDLLGDLKETLEEAHGPRNWRLINPSAVSLPLSTSP